MNIEPRRWQSDALALWGAAGRGVVSVVTGGGKTAFALLAYERARQAQPGLRLVVVVPTIALLDQWAVALATVGGWRSHEVGLFSGETTNRTPKNANVLVINTARTAHSSFSDGVPTMLVVDECHRAGSPENAKALEFPRDLALGLSATPVREFDDGFERFVEPVLGPIVFEYDYASARRDGVIAPFELHHFHFDLSAREQTSYDALTAKIARRLSMTGDDFTDDIVKRLLLARARVATDSPRRNAATVAVSERFEAPILIFHERIASAHRIALLIDRRGRRVAEYHSQLGPSLRRRNLELFKRGEVDVLVTCRALDEGLNVPNVGTAVVGASTRSTRQRIQRMGRVLRPSPGKDLATVATVWATQIERTSLEEEADRLGDVAAVRWWEVGI